MKQIFTIIACAVIVLSAVSCKSNGKQQKASDEDLQARAEWLFQQIPDHRASDAFDHSAFSADFRKVIEDAFAYDAKMTEEGLLDGEDIYYWYVGQDEMDGDRVDEIKVTEKTDLTALVDVVYITFGEPVHHTMHLVKEGDAWVIDDWDYGKKEQLRESSKGIPSEIEE